MRRTDEELRGLGSLARRPGRRAHPAALIALAVTLVASAIGAKVGLGVNLPGTGSRPAGPALVGCVGPSTIPCPPGSIRVRDPNDPTNPNEWPNDLHSRRPSQTI